MSRFNRTGLRRAIALALACPYVFTASAEALTAEAMWSLKRLGEPTISTDGTLAVVPVTHYDVAKNQALTDLWLFPVAGGEPVQLTSDEAPDTDPVFSPDGRSIAFVSKRGQDEEAQIYVIGIGGGEARRVTNLPTGAGVPKWFPDGQRIAFASAIWTDLVRWEDQGKRRTEHRDAKMTGRVWERAPISHWDRWLEDREPHLFAIDLRGGEPVAITRGSGFSLPETEYDARAYDISPAGDEVVFVADTDASGIDPNLDLIAIPSCGCKPARNLTAASAADDHNPLYSPDGRHLAFGQQRIKGFYADRRRLMLLERPSGAVRSLTEAWDRSAEELRWLPGSKALIGSIDDAGTRRLYRFDLRGGDPRAITTTPSFSGIAAGEKGVVALRQSFSEPPTLVRLDPGSGAATPLSRFNDAALARLTMGRAESITYAGALDDRIQMWVIYPPGFDPAKKYPVYMLLHGGPHNAMTDGTQWRWNAQVFAAWGYIVTWHNFHGSSGFGNAFTDSINPDRITMPYEDTIRAAEWLMRQPYVDRERLAAGGGSYGGFLAATLLGRSHPFRTLVAHAAVYNNFTQLAADYGAEKERFFDFWDRPEEFARYSPHTAAANFSTPTLVIHGQLDRRVPVNHGIELFNTLQKRGVASKLVYFPDENHWILKPQNSLFWYETVRQWLARYAPPGGR